MRRACASSLWNNDGLTICVMLTGLRSCLPDMTSSRITWCLFLFITRYGPFCALCSFLFNLAFSSAGRRQKQMSPGLMLETLWRGGEWSLTILRLNSCMTLMASRCACIKLELNSEIVCCGGGAMSNMLLRFLPYTTSWAEKPCALHIVLFMLKTTNGRSVSQLVGLRLQTQVSMFTRTLFILSTREFDVGLKGLLCSRRISSSAAVSFHTSAMKLGPLSETMTWGLPCIATTCLTKCLANSSADCVLVGKATTSLLK